jgi:enoyl-CoA hydratase/carnithine racemase
MVSPTEELAFEIRDGVGVLTLNRPARKSSLTTTMYDRSRLAHTNHDGDASGNSSGRRTWHG